MEFVIRDRDTIRMSCKTLYTASENSYMELIAQKLQLPQMRQFRLGKPSLLARQLIHRTT